MKGQPIKGPTFKRYSEGPSGFSVSDNDSKDRSMERSDSNRG